MLAATTQLNANSPSQTAKAQEPPEDIKKSHQNIPPEIHHHTPNKNTDPPKEEKSSSLYELWFEPFAKFIKSQFRLNAAYATALGHSFSAFAQLFNLKNKDNIDWGTLLFSKISLSTTCVVQAIEAFKENRLWEGVSRILEPLFIIAEDKVEDLGLARSIGLGISQVVESQDGIYQEIIKQKNLNPKSISMGQDHDINFNALLKISSEILFGGLGDKRRFLTGFSWKNICDQVKAFVQKFNFSSFKEIVNHDNGDIRDRLKTFFQKSGLQHIKELCAGDQERDKGHTTALSGYLMILGGLIGYLGKASKGFWYKLGGSLRTTGGTVADASILGNPDYKHNSAAPFLLVNGGLDFIQRFIPSSFQRIIKFVGNLSMAFFNVGVAIYLDRSSDKTNDKDHIQRFSTDLGSENNRKAQRQNANLNLQTA